MVRTYKRKTDRGSYGTDKLTRALESIKEGAPVIRVAKEFGIPPRTLRRHRNAAVTHPGEVHLGRHVPVLPEDIEKELHDHVQYMEKALYGLTILDLRRLAFEVAEAAGFRTHPFNKEKKLAGKDWLKGFLRRNSDLSIREPQATNISRAVGFNRAKVDQFYNLYEEILSSHAFSPSHIWNMDETGITSVHKPCKILASKGICQVGKATSGERGATVTVVCAMSAAGVHLPPMFIFPRKRMVEALMIGAPPQSVGAASPSGWTDSELFMKWLQHFAEFTNSRKEVPHIIILDGHHSHKSLAAINFCRERGIHLLTLPPHTTHKMQPLDRTLFKALKSAYNSAADCWMVSNPGKRISFYDMAPLFGKAFLRTATPEKAVNGFTCCGLWPFDRNIFTDEDFLGSNVTDEAQPPESQPDYGPTSASPGNGITCQQESIRNEGQQQQPADTEQVAASNDSHADDGSSFPHMPSIEFDKRKAAQQVIESLSPIPKLSGARTRKRKAESAALLTSSPYKRELEAKDLLHKKPKHPSNKLSSTEPPYVSKRRESSKNARKGKKKVARRKSLQRHKKTESSSEDETWPCLICCDPFANSKSRETWIQCQICLKWAHEACTAGDKQFICPNCVSDDPSE